MDPKYNMEKKISDRLDAFEHKIDALIILMTGGDAPDKGMLFRLTMLEKDKARSGLIINWLAGTISVLSATVIGELVSKFIHLKGG